jgi:hypothetical protein
VRFPEAVPFLSVTKTQRKGRKLMPNVAGKYYTYTPAGKKAAEKAAQSLLTKQQRTLPKAIQAKIIKKKMGKA